MATARRWAKVPHLLVIVGEDGLAAAAKERHESVGALGGAVLRALGFSGFSVPGILRQNVLLR
jgi:hypothetical protein